MPSLLDIARNLRKTVEIGDHKLPVRGLTTGEIADLVIQFPELQQLIGGRGSGFNMQDLLGRAPGAVAAVVATALAEPRTKPSEEDIQVASELPGAVVIDLVVAIAELSLPRALVRPFVAAWEGLGSDVADAVAGRGEAPATK